MPPLRICIDARLRSGQNGGVEQFILGLARGCSSLQDGDEEYLFLVYRDSTDWLTPYLSGPCRLLLGTVAPEPGCGKMLMPFFRIPLVGSVGMALARKVLRLAESDGTAERAGAALLHFPKQDAFRTDLPSIYQPWDLQHRQFPEFFHPLHIWHRDRSYRAFCGQATRVVAATEFARREFVQHYAIPKERTVVIASAPPIAAYPEPSADDLAAARRKFDLPATFLYLPAQTWPHKNHLAIIEALAVLRDRQKLEIPLVCSGSKTEYHAALHREIGRLGMGRLVRFVGFVSPIEVRCLYQLCRGMVFPSKFEGFGLPVVEAFWAGVPVACSNATCLPEVAGEAALFFPPEDAGAIQEALLRLWTDEALRRRLAEAGRERTKALTLDRVARTYRALYRQVLGRGMTDEDRALLKGTV